MISEDLKREMVGDKFYSRNHEKGKILSSAEMNNLQKIHTLSHIEESNAHYDRICLFLPNHHQEAERGKNST